MNGYLTLSPPLSAAEHQAALGFSTFRSVPDGSGGVDRSRLMLGSDPDEFEIRPLMESLVESGHDVYLNAIQHDEEGGYFEWFGFGAQVSCSRPSAPLEEVRFWMGPGAQVDLDELQSSMLELLSVLHVLGDDPAQGLERAQRLRDSLSRPRAAAMLWECLSILSPDLANPTDFHLEPWRQVMGVMASLLLRACLPPALEVAESDLESFVLKNHDAMSEIPFQDVDSTIDQAIGIAQVADALKGDHAADLLVCLPPHLVRAMCGQDIVLGAIMRRVQGDVMEGVGGHSAAQIVGGFEYLLPLMPAFIRVAAADASQSSADFVQAVSWDCREHERSEFERHAEAHPETARAADAFQKRMDEGTW